VSVQNEKKNLSRRDFLRLSAVAAAGATLASQLPATVGALAAPATQSSGPVTIKIVSGQDATEIDVRKQVALMYRKSTRTPTCRFCSSTAGARSRRRR
jgi:anaerobic selenocysteine-containing dehydrogenase